MTVTICYPKRSRRPPPERVTFERIIQLHTGKDELPADERNASRELLRDMLDTFKGEGLMVYRCQQMNSPHYGDTTIRVFGKCCTLSSFDEACRARLGDMPSQYQFPIAYFLNPWAQDRVPDRPPKPAAPIPKLKPIPIPLLQ